MEHVRALAIIDKHGFHHSDVSSLLLCGELSLTKLKRALFWLSLCRS